MLTTRACVSDFVDFIESRESERALNEYVRVKSANISTLFVTATTAHEIDTVGAKTQTNQTRNSGIELVESTSNTFFIGKRGTNHLAHIARDGSERYFALKMP